MTSPVGKWLGVRGRLLKVSLLGRLIQPVTVRVMMRIT
jgi:hypothetical protein